MIYIVEDEPVMAECLAGICTAMKPELKKKIFSDAIAAVTALDEDERKGELPKLILLDILLNGPNGFTLLNELASYPKTAEIPVIVISSLGFQNYNLSAYGVVGILNKENLTPTELSEYLERYV